MIHECVIILDCIMPDASIEFVKLGDTLSLALFTYTCACSSSFSMACSMPPAIQLV